MKAAISTNFQIKNIYVLNIRPHWYYCLPAQLTLKYIFLLSLFRLPMRYPLSCPMTDSLSIPLSRPLSLSMSLSLSLSLSVAFSLYLTLTLSLTLSLSPSLFLSLALPPRSRIRLTSMHSVEAGRLWSYRNNSVLISVLTSLGSGTYVSIE